MGVPNKVLYWVSVWAFSVCTLAILVGAFELIRALYEREWEDAGIAFVVCSVVFMARRSLHMNLGDIREGLREIRKRDPH